jgi:hypothetical protein
MLGRVITFLLGIAAGVILCFAATNFHVVRAQDGFHLVHKQRARMAEAYVDVREFGVTDWTNHSELALELNAVNKQYVMGESTASVAEGSLSNKLPNWIRR